MENSYPILSVIIPPYGESGFEESPTATRAMAKAEGSMPKPKTRCLYNGCKTKLGLTPITCKCGFQYCASHRIAEEHECTYDYHKNAVKQLSSMHVKIVKEKINYI